MKLIKLVVLLGFCLNFQFCKKSEPGRPIPVLESHTHIPTGYNPNTYHNKVILADGFSYINEFVIDITDNRKAFLIGQFNNSNIFGVSANGIVKFSAIDNSFSYYPVTNYGNNVFRSMLQGSNGKHYLGGSWSNSSFSQVCFGRKDPGSSNFTYTLNFNNWVHTIKEAAGNIYIGGEFNYVNSTPSSPMVSIDATTNGVPAQIGNTTFSQVYKMQYFNSEVFAVGSSIYGRIMNSSGGPWSTNSGGGFNNECYDIEVFNGHMYAAGAMSGNTANSISLNYVNEYSLGTWVRVGNNNLPSQCYVVEYDNGTLYAAGANYIYYLDNNDNKWKSIPLSGISFNSLYLIKIINGRLYGVDNDGLFELTK